MGNTGVALSTDGSAPFLNPATIVRIDDSALAFSVNMYSYTASSFSNWHQPGAVDTSRFGSLALADTSLSGGRFDSIPSTLCLFFTLRGFRLGEEDVTRDAAAGRKGRQKLAACLGNTEREQQSFPAINYRSLAPGASATQAQSFSQSWSRFRVGPTASVYVTDDLAFGASLHAIYTTYGALFSSSNVTVDPAGRAIVSSLDMAGDGRSVDLAAVVGITYRLARGTTLGLSLQTPSVHVAGTYDANAENSFSGVGDHADVALGHGGFAARSPFRVSAGLGEEWRKLKLEVDAEYYAPVGSLLQSDFHTDTVSVTNGLAQSTSSDFGISQGASGVLDTSVGFEYFVAPSFSVLGGFGTDFSAAPYPSANAPALGTFYEERMHRAIVSAGVGSYGEASDLLLGVQAGYGWGKALAVNGFVLPNEISVVDKQSYSIVFVVAGNVSLHAIENTLRRMQHLVTKGR